MALKRISTRSAQANSGVLRMLRLTQERSPLAQVRATTAQAQRRKWTLVGLVVV